MSHYYNEHAPFPAQWLRNLMEAGEIPQGRVDERSIRDVDPADVADATQAHFFAGIAGWSLALRLAGWPDDRRVWTGSCPCQPFSAAGKRKGTADDRHLWPEFRRLIAECRPPVVFGEQVASADGRLWLAGVRDDLETLGYACGAADLCAAGVSAPHIRQRLFWLADAGPSSSRRHSKSRIGTGTASSVEEGRGGETSVQPPGRGAACGLALAERAGVRLQGRGADETAQGGVQGANGEREWLWPDARTVGDALAVGVGDANDTRPQGRPELRCGAGERAVGSAGLGCWSDFDLIPCADGKARRVESGTFPLAHGVPGRVGRISAYGNAIVPLLAAEFIAAYLDVEREAVPA